MSKTGFINKLISRGNATVQFVNPGSFSEAPLPISKSNRRYYPRLEQLPIAETVDLEARVFEPVKSLLPKALYLSKEPIIFLHGIFGNSRMYSKQSQQLANTLQTPVISVDIRNHGESPRALPMNYPTLAKDVAKFIKDSELSRVNIAGFSMGAKVAMAYSLMYPETVARTVVIDNSPVIQSDIQGFLFEFAEGLTKIIEDAKIRSSENDWFERANNILKTVIKDADARKYLLNTNLVREYPVNPDGYVHLALPVKHFKEVIRNEVGDWPVSHLQGKQFDGPTLFLRATQSPFIKKSHHKTIESYFPAFTVENIKATHLLIDERPEQFVSIVSNWFKENPVD